MKRSSLVAIFAHPDDEAFGPAGTICQYSKTHDVYIVCATRGEAGENYLDETTKSIGEVREQELRSSAKLLGVKEVFFLDYEDGSLCNNKYHDMAGKIQSLIEPFSPEILLTYELRGVSGHIDHVVVAMVANYLFHKLVYIKKLMSYVLLREVTDLMRDYFIYVPHGFKRERVDEIVDISHCWDLKKQAINLHRSQRKDVSRMLSKMDKYPKEEFFLVHKK